jgi:hypothetical protein
MKFTLGVLAAALAYGAQIFSNGLPDGSAAVSIGNVRAAEDFTIGAATIAGVRFYIAANAPVIPDPQGNFSGQITYALYNDSAGAIGALLATGTVAGLSSVPTGLWINGVNAGISSVDFNLVTPVNVGAGAYWLELHEGPSLLSNDGTSIGWALASFSSGNGKFWAPQFDPPPAGVSNRTFAFELYGTPGEAAHGVPEPSAFALTAALLVVMRWRKARL